MWIQPRLLVLLGVVAISAAMAIRKVKTTKKHNQQQDNDLGGVVVPEGGPVVVVPEVDPPRTVPVRQLMESVGHLYHTRGK